MALLEEEDYKELIEDLDGYKELGNKHHLTRKRGKKHGNS